MSLFRGTIMATLAVLATTSLTGCAAMDAEFTAANKQAVEAINLLYKNPPAEYAFQPPSGGSYGLDYINPNMGFGGTKTSLKPLAEECKKFLSYGLSLGATHWDGDPSYVLTPIADNPAAAQVGCVNILNYLPEVDGMDQTGSPMFQMHGTFKHDGKTTPFYLEFNRATATPVNENSVYTYSLSVNTEISTDSGMSGDGWSGNTGDPLFTAYQDTLVAVDKYRSSHPGAALYSKSSVTAALATFKNDLITVKPVADAKGQYTYLEVAPKAKDTALLPACISIRKFDEKYFGTHDPHGSYTIGYLDKMAGTAQYGQAVTGACPAA